MNVTLSLKNWSIIQDEKTKLPKVCGKYAVMMGEKEVAVQEFNSGYSAKDLGFSGELIKCVMATESLIRTEIEGMLS